MEASDMPIIVWVEATFTYTVNYCEKMVINKWQINAHLICCMPW